MTATIGEPPVQAPARTTSERIMRALNRAPVHIALGLIALIWLLPTIGLFITSFRPRSEIQNTGWWTFFTGNVDLTLDNYRAVIDNPQADMLGAFLNSLFITIPSTILPVLLASFAAFAFAWIPFRQRDSLFLVVIALLLIPIQMTLIPLSALYGFLGIAGSYPAVWLTHVTFALPFGIFLLRNFFITLPRDLIEAARIDGASNWNIFRQVVVPLSVPALASYGIFQFLWTWNDLLIALVFTRSAQAPMTVQITSLLGTYASEWNLLAAAAFMVMAVPLIVFFSLQRYFVQGLLAGSVK
jgi:alpha-glucoside transport system permease protein